MENFEENKIEVNIDEKTDDAKTEEVKTETKEAGTEEEKTEEVKKDVAEEPVVQKPTVKKKVNHWKIASAVLLVLFLVSLFSDGFTGAAVFSGEDIGKDVAAETTEDFVNTLLAGQVTAEVLDVSEEYGLYKVELDIAGEETVSYLSPDGELFFAQPIDIGEYLSYVDNTDTYVDDTVDDVEDVVVIELTSEDNILGEEDAPVTVIEYSDFECPYCANFWSGTLPSIKSEYVDTGMVKFAYRHFPLSFHANAQNAAEASECAGDQGMFWEYHDKLYENQNYLDIESLKQYAIDLELDTEEFNDCLESGKYTEKVNDDMASGAQYGVSGTPATFVNGILVTGAQPFSSFQAIIEAELSS